MTLTFRSYPGHAHFGVMCIGQHDIWLNFPAVLWLNRLFCDKVIKSSSSCDITYFAVFQFYLIILADPKIMNILRLCFICSVC